MEINENEINENPEKKENNVIEKNESENKINEENNNNKIEDNINQNKINEENDLDNNDMDPDNDINEDYNNYEDYDYNNDDNIDNVQNDQEEILETMFINAKNSVNENKINLYLDIISLDESKEKVWSYKCYQEICLICLQFEDHLMFPLYYKEIMKAVRTFDAKKLRIYVEQTVILF